MLTEDMFVGLVLGFAGFTLFEHLAMSPVLASAEWLSDRLTRPSKHRG